MDKKLRKLAAAVLGCPEKKISIKTSPSNQPLWDSLAHISIINAVEDSFGIEFSTTEILSIKNIQDIQLLINKKKK